METLIPHLRYLHNLFDGEAKRVYDDHDDGRCATIGEAVLRMSEEYNSPVRQTAVKNELSSLRMSTLRAQGKREMDALASVHATIVRLAPQLPPTHRGDAHKVDVLWAAVVGTVWAIEPMSRIATSQLTYQQLYNELVASLQLHVETLAASARDAAPLGLSGATSLRRGIAPVNYTGQGMY